MSEEVKSPEHKQIVEAYQDLKVPRAFSGINSFYVQYKKKYPRSVATRAEVKKAIESLPIYQLHVGKKERFKRRSYNLPPGSLSKCQSFYCCIVINKMFV